MARVDVEKGVSYVDMGADAETVIYDQESETYCFGSLDDPRETWEEIT